MLISACAGAQTKEYVCFEVDQASIRVFKNNPFPRPSFEQLPPHREGTELIFRDQIELTQILPPLDLGPALVQL
jgi:hypothetical protein